MLLHGNMDRYPLPAVERLDQFGAAVPDLGSGPGRGGPVASCVASRYNEGQQQRACGLMPMVALGDQWQHLIM